MVAVIPVQPCRKQSIGTGDQLIQFNCCPIEGYARAVHSAIKVQQDIYLQPPRGSSFSQVHCRLRVIDQRRKAALGKGCDEFQPA